MTEDEGYSPFQLMQASDGNLWGLTSFRNGYFFADSLAGTSITNGTFNCATTGCQPQGMMEARDGNFSGPPVSGGTRGINPVGTVFKIASGLPH